MKYILYSMWLILALSACNIKSSDLINTSWVIDKEAYSAKEQIPEGLDKGIFCIEFEQDSAFSGSIYQGLDHRTGDTVWYYLGNYKNKIYYHGRDMIDSLPKNERAIMTVKAYKFNEYLYINAQRRNQEKIIIHLKPAPDFDRNNRSQDVPIDFPPIWDKEEVDSIKSE